MRLTPKERTATASARTLRRLDQDYVCAEVGKDLAAKLAAFIGEIEHTIWRKHRQPSLTPSGVRDVIRAPGYRAVRDSVTFDAELTGCLQSHLPWTTKCRIRRMPLR
jgi:hypothetical protein